MPTSDEILSYIKELFNDHVKSLEDLSEVYDNSDRDYHEGAVESLGHVLLKFGAME